MVFKQRTVQDASKRMYEDARVSLNNDSRAIQNLEWQLGTQETALKRRNDAAARHDAMQLKDFAAATKHSTEGKIKTLQAFKDLIAPGGPAWSLLEHQVEKNKSKARQKGIEDTRKGQYNNADFGASKIHGNQQSAIDTIETIEPGLTGELGLEIGQMSGEVWTKKDQEISDTIGFLTQSKVIDTTNKNLLVNAASDDTATQSEMLSGLFGAFGGKVGYAQGVALAKAESFDNGFLGWKQGDSIPRTFTYKGQQYEYKASELDDDYLSQETPIPYLNSVDAYANQILMDARKAGLSDEWMQKFITPIVNKKAAELKSTYRQNWADAKNRNWIKEVNQSVVHGYKTAMGTDDPEVMNQFIAVVPQYLRQLQAYNARLRIKDPKKQGMKDLKEALKVAGAGSLSVSGQGTGLEHLKDVRIPVDQVPWVSKKLADKDGMVKFADAFPKEWSDEKIDEMNAEVIDKKVKTEEKERDGMAKIAVDAVTQCYRDEGHNSTACKEQEKDWHIEYARDYPDMATKLKDKSTLMRDTKTGYTFLKEVLGDKKRITDEDLLYVTKESVDLLKKELTQPGRSWEDVYEPVALEKQVPKDRVTFYHDQIENGIVQGILGTVPKSDRNSNLTDRVVDITTNEILPDKMREIQARAKLNNQTLSPEELMRDAVAELNDEFIESNPDGGLFPPKRFTKDSVEGLIHFDRLYNRGAPSLDKQHNKDASIFQSYRLKQATLVSKGESIFDKPNLLAKNLKQDQFDLNNKGDIDVLWYRMAADKVMNPPGENYMTPEEIRQLHAPLQNNPVNAAPKINWEQSKNDIDDRIGIKNIDVNNQKKTSRLIAAAPGGPIWGTSSDAARIALAWPESKGMDITELTQFWDEEVVPFAINYKQTNNTKATPSQVAAGRFLGIDLNIADWHRDPRVRKFCHDCRTGGLA